MILTLYVIWMIRNQLVFKRIKPDPKAPNLLVAKWRKKVAAIANEIYEKKSNRSHTNQNSNLLLAWTCSNCFWVHWRLAIEHLWNTSFLIPWLIRVGREASLNRNIQLQNNYIIFIEVSWKIIFPFCFEMLTNLVLPSKVTINYLDSPRNPQFN